MRSNQAVRNPAITVDQLDLAFSAIAPTHLHMSPTPKMTSRTFKKKIDAHMQFVLTTSHWPELEEKRAAQIRADRPDLSIVN